MTRELSRRETLVTAGALLTLPTVGCTAPQQESNVAYSSIAVGAPSVLDEAPTTNLDESLNVVHLRSDADVDRLDRGELREDAREFLAQTDFEAENLLVVQVKLAMGSDECSVYGLNVRNGRLSVRLEYTSRGGPAAITLSQKLVRFSVPDGQSIENVVVLMDDHPWNKQSETFTGSE